MPHVRVLVEYGNVDRVEIRPASDTGALKDAGGYEKYTLSTLPCEFSASSYSMLLDRLLEASTSAVLQAKTLLEGDIFRALHDHHVNLFICVFSRRLRIRI